ncbi:SMR family transporter [Nocardioides sp. CN2-186]|uniref:DMT family transporter n=1 Tax=Nocardioides tweenelious TaxID=3156607 RepID=UPI0032B5628D
MTYGFLAIAIAVEVMATMALRASAGFSRLLPCIVVVVGYGLSFYLLSVVLQRGLGVAVVYAVWSAAGIVLVTLIGSVFLDEHLSIVQLAGIALIIGGVVALEVGAVSHT